jgi:hypothetical protein
MPNQHTNTKTAIMRASGVAKLAGWFAILEKEGWGNLEVSIDDYGALIIWGDKIKKAEKPKSPKETGYAKPSRRS